MYMTFYLRSLITHQRTLQQSLLDGTLLNSSVFFQTDLDQFDPEWPEVPGKPSSFETTTTQPTTTTAPQTCPQNISREVDTAGDKARIVFNMPISGGGYMPVSMNLPAGVHEQQFDLDDGRQCNLVITITGRKKPNKFRLKLQAQPCYSQHCLTLICLSWYHFSVYSLDCSCLVHHQQLSQAQEKYLDVHVHA